MVTISAGILLYRHGEEGVEVLLVHPGGPFWTAKDQGAWSIPKGEVDRGESPFSAALRECREELGFRPSGPFCALEPVSQSARKTVIAWAVEGNFNPADLKSATFKLEWPPCSGRISEFPEVDRAEWFGLDEARVKMLPGQLPLLERLAEAVGGRTGTGPGRSG